MYFILRIHVSYNVQFLVINGITDLDIPSVYPV